MSLCVEVLLNGHLFFQRVFVSYNFKLACVVRTASMLTILNRDGVVSSAGHVARMGEERWVYRILVGKPEGKRRLGRPGRRWVDNIRMDLQEVDCGYMDWIGLAQYRDRWRTLLSAVMNLRVP